MVLLFMAFLEKEGLDFAARVGFSELDFAAGVDFSVVDFSKLDSFEAGFSGVDLTASLPKAFLVDFLGEESELMETLVTLTVLVVLRVWEDLALLFLA